MLPNRNDGHYLSTEEVARVLGFSVRAVTNWLKAWDESGGKEGIPGGFKVGKCWRVDRRELDAWVQQQKGLGKSASAG